MACIKLDITHNAVNMHDIKQSEKTAEVDINRISDSCLFFVHTLPADAMEEAAWWFPHGSQEALQ